MVTSLHRRAPTNLCFPVGICCFSHQKLQLPLGWALWVLWPTECSVSAKWDFWAQAFKELANYLLLANLVLGHHPSNSATTLGEAQAREISHVNENWQATINSPRWGPQPKPVWSDSPSEHVIFDVPAELGSQIIAALATIKKRNDPNDTRQPTQSHERIKWLVF